MGQVSISRFLPRIRRNEVIEEVLIVDLYVSFPVDDANRLLQLGRIRST